MTKIMSTPQRLKNIPTAVKKSFESLTRVNSKGLLVLDLFDLKNSLNNISFALLHFKS